MQSDPTTSLKTCSRCNKLKPGADFWKSTRSADGLNGRCKACCNADRRTPLARGRTAAVNRKHYARNHGAVRIRINRWRAENREQARIYARQWRERNPGRWRVYKQMDRLRRKIAGAPSSYDPERARQYYLKNQERMKAGERERYRLDPSKATARAKMRLHRQRAAGGSFTAAEWEDLCTKYGNRCLACGRDDLPLTIDHVVPISRGGTNWITDVQPLCKPCNTQKAARTIDYRPLKEPGHC